MIGTAWAGVSGSAFHYAMNSDAKWIYSDGWQTVNEDTAASRNAVANLGFFDNVSGSLPGPTVYVNQQNTSVGISCKQTAVNVMTGQTYSAGLTVSKWLGTISLGIRALVLPKITGLPAATASYAVGVYCTIPAAQNGRLSSVMGVR
jgi:hypothetical protein